MRIRAALPWLVTLCTTVSSTTGCDLVGVGGAPASTEKVTAGTGPSTPPSAKSSSGEPAGVDVTASKKAFLEKLSAAATAAKAAATAAKSQKPAKQPCGPDVAGAAHAYALAYASHLGTDGALSADERAMTAFRPPRHDLLEGDTSLADASLVAPFKTLIEVPYAVIISTNKLTLPSVDDDQSFLSGVFEGWAHVVALETGAVQCSAPLGFLSSKKVEWKETLSAEQAAKRFDVKQSDASFHVRVDFFMQGRAALEKVLADVAPKLKLATKP